MGDERKDRMNVNTSAFCSPTTTLTVVNLNNTETTSNFYSRPVGPHNTGDVDPSIRRDTSGEVNEVGDGEDVARLPGHRTVVVVEVGSGSTEGKGEHGALEGRREGLGLRSS